MRSPTLPPMRMKAAETSASRAMADCTPLTVVPRSWTTDAIDTFMSDVSTTRTNIAIASRMPRRRSVGATPSLTAIRDSGCGQHLGLLGLELRVGQDALLLQRRQFLQLGDDIRPGGGRRRRGRRRGGRGRFVVLRLGRVLRLGCI